MELREQLEDIKAINLEMYTKLQVKTYLLFIDNIHFKMAFVNFPRAFITKRKGMRDRDQPKKRNRCQIGKEDPRH